MEPTHHLPRPPGTGRERFAAELAARRTASGKSFTALARELDHPRSTIHGWCRGDHLPFPRDDELFARLLRAIGVADTEPWLTTLRALRGRAGQENPYQGLEPYTEADAGRFHGRTALVDRLVAAVDETFGVTRDGTGGAGPPLVVVGASGSGKTSLLRAGLLGRLGRRPGHATAAVTPGVEPVDRVGAAITRLSGVQAATLVVDQFEELFTIAPSDEVDATVAALTAAMRSGIGVVIGVRADFFHHLAAIPYLLEGLDRRQVVVGPMTTHELTEAIVAPAAQAGLTLTPSLVAHLVQEFDVQTQRARGSHALPLLSHVLFRLAESAAGDVVGLADYQSIGGLRDALQRTADEALAAVPDGLHPTCRELFLQLVELRADTSPTRRIASRDALDRLATSSVMAVVLDAFVTRRLLTVERDTVTLTHEALLTAWPTLEDWVEGQRGDLLVRRRIRSAHHTWLETGRPVDALLRGSLLDEALALLDGSLRSTLDDDEQAYVAASRLERDAAVARDAAVLSRQLAAQSDLLAARDPSLSGHLALEAVAVADTVEARSAVLRCCTSTAGPRFVGATGPSAVAAAPGVGRAVAAFHTSGAIERYDVGEGIPIHRSDEVTPVAPQDPIHAVALDATGACLATASRTGRVAVVRDGAVVELDGFDADGPLYAVAVSPDGDEAVAAGAPPGIARWRSRGDGSAVGWDLVGVVPRDVTTFGLAVRWSDGLVATASQDGVVSLWDRAGDLSWSASAPPAAPVASAVAFSPDGRVLAAGYHDGSVRVWSLHDGTPPIEQPLGSAAFATWVNGVDFSPDGRVLAAASSDGTVRLWDTSTWRELRAELRHPSVVSGVRFLAERWLITSSEDGIVRTWDVSGVVTGSDASVWGAAFDELGTTLVTASRTLLTIERGDARRGGTVRHRTDVPAPTELQLFSGVCDITADGSLVVAGTRSGAVVLVDATSATPVRTLRGSLDRLVEGVTLVQDAVTVSDTVTDTVVAVDSGGHLHRWVSSRRDDVGVISSDGLAVSDGTALTVVDLGDGLVGVTTEPGELVVVDVGGGAGLVERARFRPGEAFPIAVARRPGHPTIATGGADRAVSIWSVADWEQPQLVERLVGPAGHVMTIDVDRTGRRLAAGTTDGQVWIWEWDDADRIEPWATFDTGEAGVYAVRFAPDGRHLVSAGPNQRVTWWPLDVDVATDAVRARIGDPLTDLERVRLLPTGT